MAEEFRGLDELALLAIGEERRRIPTPDVVFLFHLYLLSLGHGITALYGNYVLITSIVATCFRAICI